MAWTAPRVTTLGEMVAAIGAQVAAAEAEALETWRRWANESDIRGARSDYRESIDTYEKALAGKRAADAVVKERRDAHAEAISDASFVVEFAFEKKGASWVQVREPITGAALAEPRPVDAAGRKEWIAREAAKTDAVKDAADLLAKAEWAQAQAVDAISVADRRVSAAKYQLQADTVMLTTLALAASLPWAAQEAQVRS